MENKQIYIYGIIPNFYTPLQFIELEELGLFVIPYQNISAIVSETEYQSLENLSRDLLAHMLVHHQKITEGLMDKGFSMILPMRLGSIVNSREEVLIALKNHYELICDALQKIENRIEIDLVATWNNLSDVFTEICQQDDIFSLKQSYQKNNKALTKNRMQEIGRVVKQELEKKKGEIEKHILDSLSTFFIDYKKHEVMNDTMISNTAFLLKRKDEVKFEAVINQLNEKWEDKVNFKLVGPLPCYSFFTLELNKINPEQVRMAKDLLEVQDTASANEIRKSFLEKAKRFHPDKNEGIEHEENFKAIKDAYQILLDYLSTVETNSKDEAVSLISDEKNKPLLTMTIKE